jgi:hypothetical protein
MWTTRSGDEVCGRQLARPVGARVDSQESPGEATHLRFTNGVGAWISLRELQTVSEVRNHYLLLSCVVRSCMV